LPMAHRRASIYALKRDDGGENTYAAMSFGCLLCHSVSRS
jgi:hypothetical protein